jgi:hypothetical protein
MVYVLQRAERPESLGKLTTVTGNIWDSDGKHNAAMEPRDKKDIS